MGKKLTSVLLCLSLLFCLALKAGAQQELLFNVGGKNYSAEITWVVKHNGMEYRSQTTHTLEIGQGGTFDLAVFFNFKNDSVPAGNDVVWGFQFAQNGNLLSPANNEKRSRSRSLFQRFSISGAGAAQLTLIPKVWQRGNTGRFETIKQGSPAGLEFSFIDPAIAAPKEQANLTTGKTGGTAQPGNDPQPKQPGTAQTPETVKESSDYSAAQNVKDTIQKTRALIDFVDKYAAQNPKSVLVAKAVKDIPLGISVPTIRGEGTYAYTLDYPVDLLIDSAKVRGWKWNLSKTPAGKYELVLTDLRDSVHYFALTDAGKNAPFNLPKELRPFDKIRVELLGENRDSFRLRVTGGSPPFIVFISENGFPVARYIIEKTNAVHSFSKNECESCRTGSYTLEVYNSDFSTLLLRMEKAIHVTRISYLMILLACVVGFPVLYFTLKILLRLWRWLVYRKTLLEIRVLENEEIKAAEKRKKGQS